jgi:hypothetical protein
LLCPSQISSARRDKQRCTPACANCACDIAVAEGALAGKGVALAVWFVARYRAPIASKPTTKTAAKTPNPFMSHLSVANSYMASPKIGTASTTSGGASTRIARSGANPEHWPKARLG